MPSSFKQIVFNDPSLTLFQSNVATALTPLQSQPMVGGNLLKGIALVAGQDNLIPHNLGYTPSIFFIGNLNANATVWSPISAALSGASSSSSQINLWCSADCTIALWVN